MRRPGIVGGKAANLSRLFSAGFRVPDFFVVSTKASIRPHILRRKRFIRHLQKLLIPMADARATFAVRSSAPNEDTGSQSLAGQMQTFLRIKSVDDILQAVKDVMSSANKAHLRSYLESTNRSTTRGTAVIVQKMIEARFSGVIFTSHPVSGDPNEMLLEIVRGDCENLVGGAIEPVRATISKRDMTLRILSHPLTPEMKSFVDNDVLITRLADLAVQVELLFSTPQDIEWAYDGAEFWLLQSRPITTLTERLSRIVRDKNKVAWTDYFFAERFTEPVSPLGWSFLRPIIQKNAFQMPLWILGLDGEFKAKKYFTLIDGIPHVRLKIFKRLYELFPQKFIAEDKRRALHLQHSFSIRRIITRTPFLAFRLLLNPPHWFPLYNLFRWKEFERSLEHRLHDVENENSNGLFGAIAIIRQMQALSDKFLGIHSWSITFADIFYSLLRMLAARCGGDFAATDALLSGLPGNETVRATIAISQCNAEDSICLDSIVKRYGHRSKNLDIASKTWGEDRDLLIKMAAVLKQSPVSPQAAFAERVRARQDAEKNIIDRIAALYFPANLFIKAALKLILHFARQFMLLRENQRNAWHKILAQTRTACLDLGERLQAEGALEKADDIFYLSMTELAFIAPGHNGWIMEQVRKKKSARIVPGSNESLNSMQSSVDGTTMHGIGVSAGVARGRAKICRSYDDVLQAQSGDILVVRAADPAWSPMFNIVAGMIMETGGVLSHASIVAREFKLPTVTSVKNATRTLLNAAVLEIDGAAGVVHVISEQLGGNAH